MLAIRRLRTKKKKIFSTFDSVCSPFYKENVHHTCGANEKKIKKRKKKYVHISMTLHRNFTYNLLMCVYTFRFFFYIFIFVARVVLFGMSFLHFGFYSARCDINILPIEWYARLILLNGVAVQYISTSSSSSSFGYFGRSVHFPV